MKKLYFIAALAAIGLASCTSEEEIRTEQSPQQITLKAVGKKATRGALDGADIPSDMLIYVFACQHAKSGETETYSHYFSDIPFINETTGSDASWGATGANWPSTGTLDFIAYTNDYGIDAIRPNSAEISLDETNKRISSMTLNFGTKLKGQTDVMYSDVVEKETKKFSLLFTHSLAWVVVNFERVLDTNPMYNAYRIRNVKVENVHLSGTNIISVDYATGKPVCSSRWESLSPAENVVFPNFVYEGTGEDPGQDYGDAAKNTNKGIMVIPGYQTKITFQYQTKNGIDPTTKEATYTAWNDYEINLNPTPDPSIDPAPAKAEWKAATKYVYNISVAENGIKFTATANSWTTTKQENISM